MTQSPPQLRPEGSPLQRPPLRAFLPSALVLGGLALGLALLIRANAGHEPNLHPGNPNSHIATAVERQALRDAYEDRHRLAAEVADGQKSFEEAGCEYRGGACGPAVLPRSELAEAFRPGRGEVTLGL